MKRSFTATILFLCGMAFCFCQAGGQENAAKRNYKEEMDRLYDQNLKKWPVPYRVRFADTRYGKTHVIESGPKNAFPVILLHPFGFNGTIWADAVADLSRRYRTYCVDTIGDMGRSSLKLPQQFPKNAQEYCDWLEDVCRFFKLKKAHFIGLSMGGWIANAMAIYKSGYVEKLVLCAPAAGIPEKIEWEKFLKYLILEPTEENMKKMVCFLLGDGRAYQEWSAYFFLALHRRDALVTPPFPFTDEQLKSIAAPILLMAGDKEVVWSSIDDTFARGRRLVRSLRTVKIPAAGHALNVDQPELVNKEILEFLKK